MHTLPKFKPSLAADLPKFNVKAVKTVNADFLGGSSRSHNLLKTVGF